MLGAAVVALTGCGGKKPADQPPPARVAVPVRVQQASATGVAGATGAARSPQYSGTVAEGSGTTLSFQVSGTITQLPIEEGQPVHRGQLIAAIDPTTYREQYEAQLAQATENLKVQRDSYRAGLSTLSDLLDAQSSAQQAASQLVSARAEFRMRLSMYQYLTAPAAK